MRHLLMRRCVRFGFVCLLIVVSAVSGGVAEADDAVVQLVLDKITTQLGDTCAPISSGYTIQPIYVSLVVQNLSDRSLVFQRAELFYPYQILKVSTPNVPPEQVVSADLWSVGASEGGGMVQIPPHGSIVLARGTLPYYDPTHPLATYCFPSTGSYILSVNLPDAGVEMRAEAAFFVVSRNRTSQLPRQRWKPRPSPR